ncbi:uncharacterized protein LOC143290880 [Babylonia areolata]|uniref:uncharacterized protein LOC143290880 n=1 Tax=Babylonia areolata TaxID=304850 RepID=UPI003FD256E1
MIDPRTLEILQSLTPFSEEGRDVVTQASRDLLLTCIRTDVRVHSVFFPSALPSPLQERLDLRTFPMEPLAVAFTAQAIANVKDEFGFHTAINKGAVDDALRDIYGSLQWKKLGFQMYTLVYPEVVKDPESGLSLQDFMGDEGHIWAERLVQQLQEPGWAQHVHHRIVRGQYTEEDYNQDMNALFVKLHILDPQSVIPAFQFLLGQRALPAVNLELATRNYLGGPLDWRAVQADVESAEFKATAPVHVTRPSAQQHHEHHAEVFYGTAVDDFIVSECRNLGLWSGLRPDNVRAAKTEGKCRVM